MSRRRVSVELGMDTADYMAHGRGATVTTKALKSEINDLGDTADNTARDIRNLTGKEREAIPIIGVLATAAERAAAGIDDVGIQAKETAGDMAALAASAELANRSVASFDSQTMTVRSTIGKVDQDIKKLEQELQKLAKEYARTGTVAARQAFSQAPQRRELAELRAMRRELSSGLPKAASNFFADAFNSLETKPALIGALVGVGVLAAPAIGAVIGGAVTGAVGFGGIVGGVVAAARNPMVKNAWAGFAKDASLEFSKMGLAFVEPVTESIGILDAELKDLHLADMFRPAAGYVTIIAHGLAGLVGGVGSGFASVLIKAGPVIDELAKDLPDLGDSIGVMLDEMASGQGNVEGLRAGFALLDGTLVATGATVQFLSNAFHVLIPIGTKVGEVLTTLSKGTGADLAFGFITAGWERLAGAGEHLDKGLVGVNGHFLDAGAGAAGMINPFHAFDEAVLALSRDLHDQLNKNMDDFIDKALSAKGATLDWAQTMLDLKKAVKEHGGSLSLTTQAGIDNNRILERGVQLAKDKRDAVYAETGSIEKANAAYDTMIAKLRAAALADGVNKTELDKWLKSVALVPTDITTTIHVKLSGLGSALDELASASGAFVSGGAHHSSSGGGSHQFAPARAGGGPVMAGQTYKVGEYGTELLTLGRNGGFVTSHAPSMAALSAAPVVNVTVHMDPLTGRMRQVLITDAQGRNIPEAKIAVAYP